MRESACDAAKSRLALGEEPSLAERRHLDGCAACRSEAVRLGQLLRWLAVDAELSPSRALDARMRAMLADAAGAARPFLRPFAAVGLSAASLLALVVVVAGALAQAGAAEQGPTLALLFAVGYLAVSTAATLPVLVLHRHRQTAVDEVAR